MSRIRSAGPDPRSTGDDEEVCATGHPGLTDPVTLMKMDVIT